MSTIIKKLPVYLCPECWTEQFYVGIAPHCAVCESNLTDKNIVRYENTDVPEGYVATLDIQEFQNN
jgi:hypothetical protein